MKGNNGNDGSHDEALDNLPNGKSEGLRVSLFSFKTLAQSEADEQGSSYAVPVAAQLLAAGYKYGLLERGGELTPIRFYRHTTLPSGDLPGGPDAGIDIVHVQHHGVWLSPAPPRLAEQFLYLILSKEDRENLIGDLAEEYVGLRVRHGVKFANLWYRKQVCASLLSLLPRMIRWGLLASVIEWVRRQT